MRLPARIAATLLSLVFVLSLSACGQSETESTTIKVENDSLKDLNSSAVVGASEIPYPVYPGGDKYRVGGENGLKIVVFATSDPFEEVDRFYNTSVGTDGMPRLTAMNDYVRYSQDASDNDPWATHRPGIVIHQFKDAAERRAVGADENATTNIILSF